MGLRHSLEERCTLEDYRDSRPPLEKRKDRTRAPLPREFSRRPKAKGFRLLIVPSTKTDRRKGRTPLLCRRKGLERVALTMHKIGFLVFDQMDELDFVGPLEVFGMASRFGADCQTLIVAEELKHVRCRHDLDVLPRHTFSDCPDLDMLIVPGGLGARTHARENPRILDFVRRQKGTVASVCTGALIVAAAGMLKGLPATTHHSSYELLREYEGVQVREGVRFVLNDRVSTSAGVSAGIDLALALTAQTLGLSVAEAVAANLEWQSSTWREAFEQR